MFGHVTEIKTREIMIDFESYYFDENDDEIEDHFHDFVEFVNVYSKRTRQVFSNKFHVKDLSVFSQFPECGYFVILTSFQITISQKREIANLIIENLKIDSGTILELIDF